MLILKECVRVGRSYTWGPAVLVTSFLFIQHGSGSLRFNTEQTDTAPALPDSLLKYKSYTMIRKNPERVRNVVKEEAVASREGKPQWGAELILGLSPTRQQGANHADMTLEQGDRKGRPLVC